jgi:predicted DsbA family dithiol-disulfide isomerase
MKERLMRAYFTEGESVAEADTLVRLGTEVGLDPARVREVVASDAYASEVRADEERARTFGISGVPFFAIDERYGVSGAQPPDVLLGALRQAYEETNATRAPA